MGSLGQLKEKVTALHTTFDSSEQTGPFGRGFSKKTDTKMQFYIQNEKGGAGASLELLF